MKTRRFGRFVLFLVIGLALVLSGQTPILAAPHGAQTSTDWRGEYYADVDLIGAPALVRNDKAIDFNWGTGAPASGLPADRFSVRWMRTVTFEEGTYRFRATVDDGIRLFVDGGLVLDEWRDGAQREVAVDRGLTAGAHALRVEYYERSGQAVARVRWEKVSSTPPDSTTWRGEYFGNLDLRGDPRLVRSDKAIDFDWGTGAPASGLPADNFSVRWTRTATFEEGTYRFRATVDDGIRLFVDGALAIDQWRDGAQREATVDRRLTAGTHTLRVEYYERSGLAVARVRWEKVSSTPPDSTTWRGEYFRNRGLAGDPALVRNDKAIDFDWGSGAPASGLPTDDFSVRWTRTATFEEGTYRFRATVDDGIRLFVDGGLVLDEWRDGAQREATVDRRLTAGTHTLRVEYYEHGGVAVARVRWEKVTPIAPDDPAWKGEYWANLNLSGNPAHVRSDPVLAFDWGQGNPGGTIPSDNFSARWTRKVNLNAGTYRFHVLVDDGIRLRLNDRLILDAWTDHDSARLTTDYTLATGTYTIKVEYYERIGNARVHVWWERVAAPGYPDWKGEYWANRDLSGEPELVRNDKEVDFDWGSGSPSSGLPADDFSARWTRQVYLDGGTYRFYALSDDGVRLWVDGQRLIDKWRDQEAREYTTEVALTKGTHSLKVEYYEHSGGARIHVWWKKMSTPSYADWKGEYWPNRDLSGAPSLVRNDPSIDFDWGTGAAATGLPKDNFSVRWTRQVTFPRGVYRLYAWADDGVRVYVDGQPALSEWHSASDQVYTVDLPLDGARRLTVEYFEGGGEARVRFWWKRIGDM
ncbi:MAG: hypothetical protein ISS56_11055 [Anaerolineae bacterium]|nr:hypothetical protein [Anaerolineae bacterium]